MPCYTSTDHPVVLKSTCGKCETTLDTDFINIIPGLMAAYILQFPEESLKLENMFYNDIKGMSSSKYNIQKTAIANAYSFRMFTLTNVDVLTPPVLDYLLQQIVCWIKKSKAYDGNRGSAVKDFALNLVGISGLQQTLSVAEFTAFPAILKQFNTSMALSFSHMCTDGLSAPVLKMPAEA